MKQQYAVARLAVPATRSCLCVASLVPRRAVLAARGGTDGRGPRDPGAAASAARTRWSAAGRRMSLLWNRRRRPRVALAAAGHHGDRSGAA